jgi:hypothetical protein
MKRSLLLCLCLFAAASLSISSDSYVDLSAQGYGFQFSDAKGAVQLSITGLPQGLAVQNYSI